jgi:GTP:adenosylcobinamide-phosphate guanylyltransferase
VNHARVTGILLAGGDGSRMAVDGVTTPKLLIDVDGRALLAWSIALVKGAVTDHVVVVDEHSDAIRALCRELGSETVHVPRSSPALKVVEAARRSASDLVLVASGDTLVDQETMHAAIRLHHSSGASSTMVLARQASLTDSQWKADRFGLDAQLVEAPEGSVYERAAWICDRQCLLSPGGVPAGDGESGPMGFEFGSVNSLFSSLQEHGVRSAIFEVEDLVVNVNRKHDVARATSFVSGLVPGADLFPPLTSQPR